MLEDHLGKIFAACLIALSGAVVKYIGDGDKESMGKSCHESIVEIVKHYEEK